VPFPGILKIILNGNHENRHGMNSLHEKMKLVLPHVIAAVEVELGCFCSPLQAALSKREILDHNIQLGVLNHTGTISDQISIQQDFGSNYGRNREVAGTDVFDARRDILPDFSLMYHL
jgi:hypothetical protein